MAGSDPDFQARLFFSSPSYGFIRLGCKRVYHVCGHVTIWLDCDIVVT